MSNSEDVPPTSAETGLQGPSERPDSSENDPNSEMSAGPQRSAKRSSLLQRAFSKRNRDVAVKFFSAYGQTWIGLNPVWLMGEALTPGAKVGTQFKKGSANLLSSAEDIRAAVATSGKDVIVIVDEKLRSGKIETGKTAEVLKAAGDNAILVVSSSIDKAQEQLRRVSAEYGPKIRKSVAKNGRDVVVVIDKALKNPLVITGVSRFAKTKGIPHADALLRLGSLALAKILEAMPEEHLEGVEAVVEEIDAAELERTSTTEETEQAAEIGKQGDGEAPKVATVATSSSKDAHDKMKKETSCQVM